MSSTQSVLYISHHFPPSFAIGGKRAWRMARYLPEHGWRAAIVTSSEPPPEQRDATPLDLPDGTSLHRTYYPRWYRSGARLASNGAIATPNRAAPRPTLLSRVGRWSRPLVGRDLWLLPRQAVHLARLARQERASVILASASPHASLAHGLAAARLAGLPFVAELRDPWTLNPLLSPATAAHAAAERRIEAAILRSAARVVVTTEATASAYRGAFPDLDPEHFVVIHNTFDPALRPVAAPPSCDGPLRLVHFGSCYAGRRLEDVFRAIALLRERGVSPERFSVRNLGRVDQRDVDLAAELGLGASFTWQTAMPYSEGLREVATADRLLLLAHGSETLFLPGKLFDYLLGGRPILAVAAPSELTEILGRTRSGIAVAPGDFAGLADQLHAALRDRDRPFEPDREALAPFEGGAAARRLAEVLSRAAAQQTTSLAAAATAREPSFAAAAAEGER